MSTRATTRLAVGFLDNIHGLVRDLQATSVGVADASKELSAATGQLSTGVQQQATGIEEVNRAVTQMEEVVHLNAAQTDQLSSTAASLSTQAEQLGTLVGHFRLGEDSAVEMKTIEAAAPSEDGIEPPLRATYPSSSRSRALACSGQNSMPISR